MGRIRHSQTATTPTPIKKHANAVRDEVTKFKKVRAIKEVFYPKWLTNTVVVKKKSGK